MNASIVSNTGPILALAGVGQIELLRYLYKRVFVPRSVHLEIEQGGKEGLGLSQYLRADWIEVQSEGNIDPLLLSQLDIGEAAVITLALKANIDLVLIDERKARKIARAIYEKNVVGTTRILLQAKKDGLLSNVGDVLKAMRENGYWIHENIIEYALRAAGEN